MAQTSFWAIQDTWGAKLPQAQKRIAIFVDQWNTKQLKYLLINKFNSPHPTAYYNTSYSTALGIQDLALPLEDLTNISTLSATIASALLVVV